MTNIKTIPAYLFGVATLLLLFVVSSVHAASSLTFDDNSITLYESPSHANHTQTFTMQLTPDPTGNVTTIYETNAECKLSLGGSGYVYGGQIVSSSKFLVFSVQAVDDQIGDGTHSCVIDYRTESTDDTNWQGITKKQTITVIDNGDITAVPQFTTKKILGDTVAEGTNNAVTYIVNISEPALDPITVYASGGPQCQLLVNDTREDSANATIESGSIEPVTFTVVARQDSVYEGKHECVINHNISTMDLTFQGVTPPTFEVSVIEDDQTFLQAKAEKEAEEAEAKAANAAVGLLDFYDSNNDGLVDSEQPGVQNFINPVTGSRNAFVLTPLQGSCEFMGTVVISNENQVDLSLPNLHFPQGIYDFTATCSQPGAEVRVTVLLDQVYSPDYGWLLRKINSLGEVSTVLDATFSNFAVQDGQVTAVTYTIVDGGPLDDDKQVNGVIVDPVGLALTAAQVQDVELLARLDDQPTSRATLILYAVGGALFVVSIGIVISQRRVQQWLYSHTPHKHVKPGPKVDHF